MITLMVLTFAYVNMFVRSDADDSTRHAWKVTHNASVEIDNRVRHALNYALRRCRRL